MSIEGRITIHNLSSRHVSRQWFYTAITRARSLSDVFICVPEKKEESLKAKKFRTIQKKIEGYKRQDYHGGRDVNHENYVDYKWVIDRLYKARQCCESCQVQLALVDYGPREMTQWSVDRIDNNLSHHKTNCQILCLGCNVAKR